MARGDEASGRSGERRRRGARRFAVPACARTYGISEIWRRSVEAIAWTALNAARS